jgi:hypothetical protein
MAIPFNSPKLARGRVTSNDGDVAVITMIAAEPMRIRRSRNKTEDQFKAEWPITREVTMEVSR